MAFIQSSHVVQQVWSAVSYPALRDAHSARDSGNEIRLGMILVAFTTAITSNANF